MQADVASQTLDILWPKYSQIAAKQAVYLCLRERLVLELPFLKPCSVWFYCRGVKRSSTREALPLHMQCIGSVDELYFFFSQLRRRPSHTVMQRLSRLSLEEHNWFTQGQLFAAEAQKIKKCRGSPASLLSRWVSYNGVHEMAAGATLHTLSSFKSTCKVTRHPPFQLKAEQPQFITPKVPSRSVPCFCPWAVKGSTMIPATVSSQHAVYTAGWREPFSQVSWDL